MAARPRRRALTEADRAEWALYARGVVVLPGRAVPDLPVEAPAPDPARDPWPTLAPGAARTGARAHPLVVGSRPAGVDSATWSRFRAGKLAASRTLDLHGRTAQRAFVALHAFLRGAHADRVRCVEVITGRGAGEAGGVIRRELPLWLNLSELRPLVLAAAHPHAANPGSVRLLLRRVRDGGASDAALGNPGRPRRL